jgi:hypothetical protein
VHRLYPIAGWYEIFTPSLHSIHTLMRTATDRLYNDSEDGTIVVKLWEIYLMYHPANLYRTLSDRSVDKGPLEGTAQGRVTFRFARTVWENEIKNLLYQYRIPVVLKSGAVSALR